MTAHAQAKAEPQLGSVVRIDDRTVLVVGQELKIAAGQPDVAMCCSIGWTRPSS